MAVRLWGLRQRQRVRDTASSEACEDLGRLAAIGEDDCRRQIGNVT